MKRRTLLTAAAALVASGAAAWRFWPARAKDIPRGSFSWKADDFLAGGTAKVDQAVLPAPSFRTEPNCWTTAEMTIGPCHANNVPLREDVSEGKDGLPMRLSIRLVDAAGCEPIKNADVEIWHTNSQGIYSGRDVQTMCTDGSEEATSTLAFRGRQMSDADGVVSFLTVYPGWYSSRAPHVHCRILVDGKELLVTQFFFDDALSEIVYGGHGDYDNRPEAETLNTGDNILPEDNYQNYIFDFAKLEGGVLDATITVGVSA